jgi:S-adenosylmethionine:tRNA ribosyltransferase-isomerase
MTFPDLLSNINIEDFTYDLTDDSIAKFPLAKRDESKLLVYDGKTIGSDKFKNLVNYLPANSLLVLNNTRVVRARLFFRKETGALIEVFCLEPVSAFSDIQLAFQQTDSVGWKCLIGNARRWKSGILTGNFSHLGSNIRLSVEKISREDDTYVLKFKWHPATLTFAEVLESAGKIPLPPYLNRGAVESDLIQYQTVFAQYDGSVAAPTAGLHFTPEVFSSLQKKNIATGYVTLHVGAGTFKPVGEEGIRSHLMHTEQVIVSRALISEILTRGGEIIAVGTTSVRTLESLYRYGVKLHREKDAPFLIKQFDPYQNDTPTDLTVEQALQNILEFLDKSGMDRLVGSTQLMIAPGYQYRMINGMVTNFHQPRSTLLLLIAAWLGDNWREIYTFALKNDFRFLSYGDACLFL